MNAVNRFIEQLNYDNDARVRAAREKASFVVYDDDDVEHELPTTWGVCPTCRGEGKHTNPSIDCNGLTRDDFDDDPDFADSYMSGHYDVTCYGCEGLRVVQVIDESRMSDDLRAMWEADRRADADCRAMEAAERRMGC